MKFHLGTIQIDKDYAQRYGEDFMDVYLFDNELKGRIVNAGLMLEEHPTLLKSALDFLKGCKQSKRIKETINYYSRLEQTYDLTELRNELNILIGKARKDDVRLTFFIKDNGTIPYFVLNSIVVSENMRNRGLGKKYINDIVSLSEKYNVNLVLDVSDCFGSSIPRLRRFYKSFGFKENKMIGVSYEMIYKPKQFMKMCG